jgi:hypothetical protein
MKKVKLTMIILCLPMFHINKYISISAFIFYCYFFLFLRIYVKTTPCVAYV